MSLPKIIVFISGSGSNLQALMDAVENGRLSAQIALVVSNRKAAYGLVRAKEAGIPTLYHPFKPYRDAGKSRDAYEADLAAKIKPFQPDLIVLAGWMHILGADFLTQFPNQVINLHPALPGSLQAHMRLIVPLTHITMANSRTAAAWCIMSFLRLMPVRSSCKLRFPFCQMTRSMTLKSGYTPPNIASSLKQLRRC